MIIYFVVYCSFLLLLFFFSFSNGDVSDMIAGSNRESRVFNISCRRSNCELGSVRFLQHQGPIQRSPTTYSFPFPTTPPRNGNTHAQNPYVPITHPNHSPGLSTPARLISTNDQPLVHIEGPPSRVQTLEAEPIRSTHVSLGI